VGSHDGGDDAEIYKPKCDVWCLPFSLDGLALPCPPRESEDVT
jgi:hypothetical protein